METQCAQGFSTYLGPQVSRGKKAGQRVPNEHQLVCRNNETLPSGDEDARRLVPLHAAEEHIDGVCQAREVSEALRGVKGQQLRVLQGEGHRESGGWGHLYEERWKLIFVKSCYRVMPLAVNVAKKKFVTYRGQHINTVTANCCHYTVCWELVILGCVISCCSYSNC